MNNGVRENGPLVMTFASQPESGPYATSVDKYLHGCGLHACTDQRRLGTHCLTRLVLLNRQLLVVQEDGRRFLSFWAAIITEYSTGGVRVRPCVSWDVAIKAWEYRGRYPRTTVHQIWPERFTHWGLDRGL